MIKLIKILILLFLLQAHLFSQKPIIEFEGVIKYNHKVIAKETNYNVEYDYSGIGKNSEYYYKDGNYRFINHDCYFLSDIFRSEEQNNYLLLNKTDTVFVVNTKIADIEIVDFELKKSVDTILGYVCDVLILKLKPVETGTPNPYRRYYFTKDLSINPEHFRNCKGNGYEFIFEKTKALPLRIEFEWPSKLIVWEAYEVKKQKVKDDIFEKQNNWVLIKVN